MQLLGIPTLELKSSQSSGRQRERRRIYTFIIILVECHFDCRVTVTVRVRVVGDVFVFVQTGGQLHIMSGAGQGMSQIKAWLGSSSVSSVGFVTSYLLVWIFTQLQQYS